MEHVDASEAGSVEVGAVLDECSVSTGEISEDALGYRTVCACTLQVSTKIFKLHKTFVFMFILQDHLTHCQR